MTNSIPQPLFDGMDFLKSPNKYIDEFIKQCDVPSAMQDFQQAVNFLLSYNGSDATFNAYRREIERLFQWCWCVAKKSITQLRRKDFEDFLNFCQNPPLHWIGEQHVPRFLDKNGERVPNAQWKPFVITISKSSRARGNTPSIKKYSLSQQGMQAIFSILSSFFNFLIQEEYTEINPVASIRQKSKFLRKRQSQRQVRRLSELQWMYVIETAEILADKNKNHERTLFIMSCLYGMYLRISELTATARWLPRMGDFKRDSDGHWWFTTVGKGNKERDITVSDAMLASLKRYRTHLNLSALPHIGETTPLICKMNGKDPITATRYIRKIVQDCFDAAIIRLREDNFHEDAEQLMSATVHWLRHTGISEDVKHRPREHVRDDAGHSSSAITDKYIDVELRARHASARKKVIKPEEA